MSYRRIILTLAFLAAPSMLTACADIPKSPQEQAEAQAFNDPLEPINRVVFDVNDFLDRLLMKPLTELYRFGIPDYVRERIANVLSNMHEPVIFANNLLQGETTAAGITAQRFLVNTTAGAAGIFEVADGMDLPQQMGDFGQTLSVWGVNGGPYLVCLSLAPPISATPSVLARTRPCRRGRISRRSADKGWKTASLYPPLPRKA